MSSAEELDEFYERVSESEKIIVRCDFVDETTGQRRLDPMKWVMTIHNARQLCRELRQQNLIKRFVECSLQPCCDDCPKPQETESE